MKLKLSEFAEVLSFEISWLEGHPVWVFLSFLIYASIIGLFLNAIRMSIKFEKVHKERRSKTYGQFSKDLLIIGLFIALSIFVVKERRLAAKFFFINSSNPGSQIGEIPELSLFILFLSLSTQTTWFPISEKQTPLTYPT